VKNHEGRGAMMKIGRLKSKRQHEALNNCSKERYLRKIANCFSPRGQIFTVQKKAVDFWVAFGEMPAKRTL
jgi:hypothetical protein